MLGKTAVTEQWMGKGCKLGTVGVRREWVDGDEWRVLSVYILAQEPIDLRNTSLRVLHALKWVQRI